MMHPVRNTLRVVSPSLLLGLLIVSGLIVTAPAWAHDPPDISFEYRLDAEKLESKVMIKAVQYRHWFDHDPARIPEMSDDEYDTASSEVRDFFAKHGPVKIDGVEVTPIVSIIDYQDQFQVNDYIDFVAITLDYGVKGVPRSVSIGWDRYDRSDPSWPIVVVGAMFFYETTAKPFQFYDLEPGATWHCPTLPKRTASLVVKTAPPQRWKIPVATLGILGLLAIFGGVAYARDLPRVPAWGTVAVGGTLAMFAAPLMEVEVDPLWRPKVELPSEQDAALVFESLHRNVYRAFDYKTEDEIYNALARSVDAELLDSIYNEVYQSLINEDEGGALSKVRGVDLVKTTVEFPDPPTEPPSFGVECRWRVLGTVSHWGHSHYRTNEYQARYKLAADETRWRIVSVDVTSQKRVDSGDGMGDAAGADGSPPTEAMAPERESRSREPL